jgi:Raf kinase inhibitor-like YbhB/YbcL family protein
MRLAPTLLAALLAAGPAAAAGGGAGRRAIRSLSPSGSAATLTVTSPAFEEGGPIPERFAGYRDGSSPPLSWSGAPRQAGAFALIVEDPDAPGTTPFVHWIAYDIPASLTSLPEGVPGSPEPTTPVRMRQGRNSFGSIGWRGMEPPAGQTHHYHVELFALDGQVPLEPGADREALLKALRCHVLAAGELAGTFRRNGLSL